SEGNVHVMSHTMHYGSGCFEGIKCYLTADGPAIFRLEDHIRRLVRSGALYGIETPFSVEELVAACEEVVRVNDLQNCYIRPIVFYGFDTLGVHPNNCPVHAAIACFNWGAYLGEDGLTHGVRITVSSWRKFHYSSFHCVAKGNGQYMNSMLAVREAKAQGFDEALLLNMEGNIAEGSGNNLFIVKDGILHTNDRTASILMGITRETVLQMAQDEGIPVEISDLTLEQLSDADEAFFTGTATEVTPIREVDGRLIGDGKPGKITTHLRGLYFDIVHGRRAEYHGWLHYVQEEAVLRDAH
ncbi:MAG: branched-chain amino acid transaminase, partial [Fidelibacterota bacterium]